ncbi:hypothetical protein CSUI_002378, partial [Cystoisospora suis]
MTITSSGYTPRTAREKRGLLQSFQSPPSSLSPRKNIPRIRGNEEELKAGNLMIERGRDASLSEDVHRSNDPYIKIVRRGSMETRGTPRSPLRDRMDLRETSPAGKRVNRRNPSNKNTSTGVATSSDRHGSNLRSISFPSTLEKKTARATTRNGLLSSSPTEKGRVSEYKPTISPSRGSKDEEKQGGWPGGSPRRGVALLEKKREWKWFREEAGRERRWRGNAHEEEMKNRGGKEQKHSSRERGAASARSSSLPAIYNSSASPSRHKQGMSLSPRNRRPSERVNVSRYSSTRNREHLLKVPRSPRNRVAALEKQEDKKRTERKECTANQRNTHITRKDSARGIMKMKREERKQAYPRGEEIFSPSQRRRSPASSSSSPRRSHCYACGNGGGMKEEKDDRTPRKMRRSASQTLTSSQTRTPSDSSSPPPNGSSPASKDHYSTRLDGCLACSPVARRRRHEGKSDREIVTTPSGVRTAEAKAEREAVIEARRKEREKLQSDREQLPPQQEVVTLPSSSSSSLYFSSSSSTFLDPSFHPSLGGYPPDRNGDETEPTKKLHTFGYHSAYIRQEHKPAFQTDQHHISCLLPEKEEMLVDRRSQKSSSLPRRLNYGSHHYHLAQRNLPLSYEEEEEEIRRKPLRNSSSLSPAKGERRILKTPHVQMSLTSLSLQARRMKRVPGAGRSISPRLERQEAGEARSKMIEMKDRQEKKPQGILRGRERKEREISKEGSDPLTERSKEHSSTKSSSPRGKNPVTFPSHAPMLLGGRANKKNFSHSSPVGHKRGDATSQEETEGLGDAKTEEDLSTMFGESVRKQAETVARAFHSSIPVTSIEKSGKRLLHRLQRDLGQHAPNLLPVHAKLQQVIEQLVTGCKERDEKLRNLIQLLCANQQKKVLLSSSPKPKSILTTSSARPSPRGSLPPKRSPENRVNLRIPGGSQKITAKVSLLNR